MNSDQAFAHPFGFKRRSGEREVLEVLATKRRDRRAALGFLKRAMKRYGRPHSIFTDRLRSYLSIGFQYWAWRRFGAGVGL